MKEPESHKLKMKFVQKNDMLYKYVFIGNREACFYDSVKFIPVNHKFYDFVNLQGGFQISQLISDSLLIDFLENDKRQSAIFQYYNCTITKSINNDFKIFKIASPYEEYQLDFEKEKIVKMKINSINTEPYSIYNQEWKWANDKVNMKEFKNGNLLGDWTFYLH